MRAGYPYRLTVFRDCIGGNGFHEGIYFGQASPADALLALDDARPGQPAVGITSCPPPSATGITNTTIGATNGPFPKSWRLFLGNMTV